MNKNKPKRPNHTRIVCIVDRLPLDDGTLLIRGQTETVSPEEAKILVKSDRADYV